ncbi:hypothetical protein ACP4OV_010027 [Aristida adscensionis]
MSLTNAIGVIGGVNECVNFFQWVKSAISSMRSQWNRTQEQKLEEDRLLQLQSDVRSLEETLQSMYDLIDLAEWRSHVRGVAVLLPKLKDAVYDAEDLLDELRWYELKVVVEGNSTQLAPFIDFFHSVTQGHFNKVTDVLKRLNVISSHLKGFGLHQTMPRFDKKLRPDTSSFPTEPQMVGRAEEMEEVIRLLGVPANSSRSHSKRKRTSSTIVASASNQVITTLDNSNEATIASVPVLAIVGIGGVGKTTLAQNISNDPRVKSHFDLIIWICVSDDFDEKRLTKEALEQTKEALEQTPGTKEATGSLNSLQHALAKNVNRKRILLILDDMWDDALTENGMCWKRFCASFTDVLHGSMMLVTTRSENVATGVCARDRFELKGLQGDIFWNFFKQCAFGVGSSNNDAELERIGRGILPKLGGSPLAAKTIGCLLCKNTNITHWNNILESELWKLPQQDNGILPALRLSYIYLPLHLKKCFSFCAVYPKDHQFKKTDLAEIWVAEGFVEAQGEIPIQDTACQYFEDLATLSFFQMSYSGTYVIHDLMHDMAQLVSKEECFIIKNKNDFKKVPESIRHLSILSSTDIGNPDLLDLCNRVKKLRTLVCYSSLIKETSGSVMDSWCTELRCMRVLICASTWELPESIRNMKHLRYLEVFDDSVNGFPSGFFCLYNLQKIYLKKCELKYLPDDFGNLINLQIFESLTFQYHAGKKLTVDAAKWQDKIGFLKNFNHFHGILELLNLGLLRKDQAAEAKLNKKESMNSLTLGWFFMSSSEHNVAQQVLEALRPSIGLKCLKLLSYPCESLPSWFHPYKLQNLTSLEFLDCKGLENISFSSSQLINLSDTLVVPVLENNDNNGIFSFLTDITISDCSNLSSLEQFLQPANVPAIKRISIMWCPRLVSMPIERFGDLRCLEEMQVCDCPNINSASLLVPSLKKVYLENVGSLGENIECCSLTNLHISRSSLTTIEQERWILPAVQMLTVLSCKNLAFITGESSVGTFSKLTHLSILGCERLTTLADILMPEYLPAIKAIDVDNCRELQSLPGDRFGSFPSLIYLVISDSPRLNWQCGMVLPSSLKYLSLRRCGYFSVWLNSCLENLTSLQTLEISFSCTGCTSIPGRIWSRNLVSLQGLFIYGCPNLESIGGVKAIENLKNVHIYDCPKLKGIKQPLFKGKSMWQMENPILAEMESQMVRRA